MKNKIILTSILAIVATCPAFATLEGGDGWIAQGITSADCVGDPLTYQNTPYSSGTITYTAQWEANKYDVKYNPGTHGTGSERTDANGATYGVNYTAKDFTTWAGFAANTGYRFIGWNTVTDQTTSDFPGVHETPWDRTSGITVYAAYEAKRYNVKYECGDYGTAVSGVNNTDAAIYDQPFVWRGDPTGSGGLCTTDASHNFSGWKCFEGSTSGTVLTDAQITSHASRWQLDTDVVCVAQWGENLVRLTWLVNGGNTIANTPASCVYNTSNGITGIQQPTKTGYHFTGWLVTGHTN